MRLAHYSQAKLNSELKKIISKHLDLNKYKLFYFGSRVTQKGDERSDIDIGISGLNPLDSELLANIREDIDKLPTLYSFDIVDFNNVSENFKNVALQKIEYIN